LTSHQDWLVTLKEREGAVCDWANDEDWLDAHQDWLVALQAQRRKDR
jgi:hypothetical protein